MPPRGKKPVTAKFIDEKIKALQERIERLEGAKAALKLNRLTEVEVENHGRLTDGLDRIRDFVEATLEACRKAGSDHSWDRWGY